MSQRVLIVEDHALLAQTLTAALQADGFEVELAKGLDCDDVVNDADRLSPDVVLLDLDLGEHGSSLECIPRLRDLGCVVVMVTAETNRARLGECIHAGALGIVPKSAPFEDLLGAIKDAAEMGSVLSQAQRDELLAEMRRQHADERERLAQFGRLTPREENVLAGLMEGKPAETIAAESFVSMATVRSQIRTLLQKLGVNSQLAAVAMARRAEWKPREPGP